MHLLLNLIGAVCAIPLVLAAMRVMQVAQGREISPRTGLALAGGMAGFWPIAHVLSGHNLSFGHVLLLLTVAAFIGHRVWVGRSVNPKRNTDFAELL